MDIKSQADQFDFDADESGSYEAAVDTSGEAYSSLGHTASSHRVDEILGHPVPDSRNLSVIGQTLKFKGDLVAEEDLLIQGRVNGTISHRAKNLTIGAHGDVKANISAQNVIVQGKITGEIRATESVVIEPSAFVVGDIYAPRVGLKEGAKFKGSIDMDADPSAASSKPAPRPADSSAKKSSERAPTSKKSKDSTAKDDSSDSSD